MEKTKWPVSYNEFHVSRNVRDLCNFDQGLFASSGNVIFANLKAVQKFQTKLNDLFVSRGERKSRFLQEALTPWGL